VNQEAKRGEATLTMNRTATLRGIATISLWADDVKAAVKWYTELLGIEPYFVRPESGTPEYVEFRIGDYEHELGIIDRKYSPQGASQNPGGVVVFWHVDDIDAILERLKGMGAKEYEPLTPREAGFITASVIDPFGNVLGIMHNPHYVEVLASSKKA
jgi:predicted enzyme related to lactoylglutathione lyase